MPKYSVIIPTCLHYSISLDRCLAGIRKWTDLSNVEIIVVQNGSGIETAEWLNKQRDLVVLNYEDRLGYPMAINNGVYRAEGEYLILLNDDAYVQGPGWLEIMEKPFITDPAMGITGPLRESSPETDIDFMIFFCVMIKRSVWNDVPLHDGTGSGMDEIFGPGAGEDMDWCMRAVKKGYRMQQVPENERLQINADGRGVTSFPIYHKGEVTVHRIPGWEAIFKRNTDILQKRYKTHAHGHKHPFLEEVKEVKGTAHERLKSFGVSIEDVIGDKGEETAKVNDVLEASKKMLEELKDKGKTNHDVEAPKNADKKITIHRANEDPTVTCTISTKGRYDTTLPMTLLAIAMQTRMPDKLVIYDDNLESEFRDIRDMPIYKHIIGILVDKGLGDWMKNNMWIIFGRKKGQVDNHQRALTECDTKYIWRVDDDNYPEPNVLETLLEIAEEKNAGAVSCNIWYMDRKMSNISDVNKQGQMKDGPSFLSPEIFKWSNKELLEPEHLHNTFLFNRQMGILAGGYPTGLSIVGHREETIFSHRLKRAGCKLYVTNKAVTYHFQNQAGGIRQGTNYDMWAKDEEEYKRIYKEEWGYKLSPMRVVVLDNGLGDHMIFASILPEMKKKYKDDKIVIACHWQDVFKDEEDVTLIGITEATAMLGANLEPYSVYGWCMAHRHEGTMADAYRRMLL